MLAGIAPTGAQRPIKAADSAANETALRGNGYGEAYFAPADPDGLSAFLQLSSRRALGLDARLQFRDWRCANEFFG
jgi:hypothetical protein